MTRILTRRIFSWLSQPGLFPLFMLAVCAAAYAPLILRLGFYWDDFPISWIASTMDGEGLTRYFSTNRPVWGLVYKMTTPILGSNPLTWQIFAIIMRWVTGLALWLLLRLTWPKHEQFAAWCSVLFVLYPGFSQQFIAFMYSHFYIILTSFLLSIALMVLAVQEPRWFWPLTAVAGLLSILNMLSMEYFFLLDLIRPFLLWVVLDEKIPNLRQRLARTLILWLPYLFLFAGAMVWRSVIFGFSTYQPEFLMRLQSQPLQAIQALIPVMFKDVWIVSIGGWVKAFMLPPADIGTTYLQRYWLLVGATGLGSFLFLLLYRPIELGNKRRWVVQPLLIGLLALFIAGGPFWITDLRPALVFSSDRFTLPFMFGTSLILAGIITWLPLPRWIISILLGLTIGFAAGQHFQYAIDYNRDWSVQRSMFWQMTWRMPDLQPGTLLLSNELPVTHYTDNSLSAPLNWIYDPNNDPQSMKYMLLYPTLRRAETFGNFQDNISIERDYLATTFRGNTNQVVVFFYQPPGCLRVLDPQIEKFNWMVPDYLRDTLSIASLTPILPEVAPGKTQPLPPPHVYGSEISRGWCYYFEKADLARQFGDWKTVVTLGDQAFSGNDYPNDPIERFPFIEGYAHMGNWQRALDLSREALAVTSITRPMLCSLWERIGKETIQDQEQSNALLKASQELECSQK